MKPVTQHPLQAIALLLAAVFMFSSMDVAMKILVESYSSFQVVFFRCAMSAPIFVVWMLVTGREQFRTAYPVGHTIRAIFGLVMLYCVGECFRELQLADAYALFFASPLLMTLLSGPVLGEPAGMARIVAATLGFAGVLIVLNPSSGSLATYGAVMGILAVIFYSFSALLLRRLGNRDGTVTIAFWFTAMVGLGAGLFAIPSWKPVDPGDWLLLTALGVTGTLGQVLLTAAFRRASVAVVAPFDYVHMVWALIYGYWLWGYLPGVHTGVGTAVLVMSGLFIIFREKDAMKRQKKLIEQAHGAESEGSTRK